MSRRCGPSPVLPVLPSCRGESLDTRKGGSEDSINGGRADGPRMGTQGSRPGDNYCTTSSKCFVPSRVKMWSKLNTRP